MTMTSWTMGELMSAFLPAARVSEDQPQDNRSCVTTAYAEVFPAGVRALRAVLVACLSGGQHCLGK